MNATVEAAIDQGRIPAKSRKKYEKLMATRPKSTRAFLSKLSPVLDADATSGDAAENDAYDPDWLNGPERSRIEAAGGPTPAAATSLQVPRAPAAAPKARGKDDAYPKDWLNASDRSEPDEGRVVRVND